MHLNAAGAGLMPACVVTAIKSHLDLEARRGAHWAAADARDAIEDTRRLAARLMGVAASHLAFGEQASRLWALAFASMPLKRGDRILIARNDWGGNILNAVRRATDAGAELIRLPTTEAGLTDIAQAAALVDERTVAICASAVASSYGLRQPVEALGSIPRPETCLYFVDGAQAIGQFELTLPGASADIMIAPGRKWLRGGRGQAMMALSDLALRRLVQPILIDQSAGTWRPDDSFLPGEDARRFEAWEFSASGRLGLRAAFQELDRIGLANVRAHNAEMLRRLGANLCGVPDLTVFEDEEAAVAFLTFQHAHVSADAIVGEMAANGIAIASVGLDYARWELEARGLTKIVRVAPHIYTTDHDIGRFTEELMRLAKRA
ncbi:aminotransferase class V-fold PLP-dependent enzyme [Bradyrhizobium sp. BR13661]|jgi:cysteine desulfurase/selenocysteine lyase|uniref:aminotransferase class V-fold PLP-dependent enzyme n=2 Tax=Pseudomonadota TaxID=1224 RepID=UPI002475841E|nr:aminotransferase class V-fold PLP-dependent enzyme [Bradyrhizobium sp. BR13661]MDH6262104.1 cysteine desulfurase/selenocysteine lyase [Bradyrhizobium sp. BR13661]